MRRSAVASVVAGALGCLLFFGITPAAAQDIDTYVATLEQAVAHLRDPAGDPAEAADLLENVSPIAVDGAPAVRPDLSDVLADLRASPPEVQRALARLEALIAALERAELHPAGNGEALAALDDVLSRGEFATTDPEDREPSLRERLGDWIAAMIETLARWLEPVIGAGEGTGAGAVVLRAIVAAVGIVSVIAVSVLVIRSIRGAMMSDVERLEAERELRLTSVEARADAERHFQAGNYREALRALYIATLLRLDEAGRVRFDRSLTNQEVLRNTQIHGDQMLLQHLSPLVDRFDDVWYGGAACSAADYQAFSRQAERVWEAQT
jgi:hypothetical protein